MCKNELVRLTTEDVNNAAVITSSRKVAEDFGKRHDNVIRDIEEIKKDVLITEEMFFKTVEPDGYGRNQKVFFMNRDGFTLLVMGFKGKKALEWKLKYIAAFNFMEKELIARVQTRAIGKTVRHSLTDSIKSNTDEGTTFQKFAYSNYTKLVYKKVLGMQVNKAKEARGLKQTDNLRDFLTVSELERVQELESKIAGYIEMRKDIAGNDKLIYEEVKKFIEK